MKLKQMMVRLPWVALLLLVMGSTIFAAVTPADFVKPPSNYEPMNFYIKDFNFNGIMPLTNDKIGVFDGEFCVGVYQMQKDFTEYLENEYIRVIAYKEYKENNVVIDPGFTEGDSIDFYLLVSETNEVVAIPDSNLTYYNTVTGEPLAEPLTFTGRGTAMVDIHSGQAKLSISADPADKGSTLPKPDEYLYFVNDNEVVNITIDSEAIADHYEFSHWTIDGTTELTDTEINIVMDANHTVVAHFALKQYTLSPVANPAEGSVVPAEATAYDALTWVDILAKPELDSGYKFSHWACVPQAEIEDSTQASTRVKMTQDVQVTAVFSLEQDSLFISINPLDAGTTVPEPGLLHVYDYGDELNLTATPAKGYKFKHWLKVDGEESTVYNTDSALVTQIDKNLNLQAVFEKKTYAVKLLSDAKMGEILVKFAGDADFASADTLYTLEYGTEVQVKAVSTDENKYPFANWRMNGIDVIDNPITVSVDTSLNVEAVFEDTTPVELSSFSVQYAPNSVSNAVLLNWQTATETNNFGFDVERSFGEEKSWEKIGFIKGAGTTSQQQVYEFIDNTASEAGTYYYRLRQVDTNGAFEYSQSVQFDVNVPLEFALKQNYPNPFNPTTNIVFQLKEEVEVQISVYDILGREVKSLVNEKMKPGTHRIAMDAHDMSAGIYFYSLKAGSFSEMKKMTLIK